MTAVDRRIFIAVNEKVRSERKISQGNHMVFASISYSIIEKKLMRTEPPSLIAISNE